MSAELADRVLAARATAPSAHVAPATRQAAQAPRMSPRAEARPVEIDVRGLVAPPPAPREGWMYAPEIGGRPSIVDDEEMRRATARPFSGIVRFFGRLFRR